jgi:enoyl-CoA hydratase
MTGDSLVLIDRLAEGVAVVTLNRPRALNALSPALIDQLVDALTTLDRDEDVRAIVIRGSGERAFAAGADIREMAGQTAVTLTKSDAFARWDEVAHVRTPLIAAVRGFALGGGCELAMTCDLIIAGEDAQFGQPEIKLGVIPGVGGTQRLTRAVGKARAMELVLTGRSIDAREAERIGLVTRVVPAEETFAVAEELARTIAAMPPLAVIAAKDAVNHAEELGLSAGLDYERRLFTMLFGTADQKEGMAAFVEKRPAAWRGE